MKRRLGGGDLPFHRTKITGAEPQVQFLSKDTYCVYTCLYTCTCMYMCVLCAYVCTCMPHVCMQVSTDVCACVHAHCSYMHVC